jgi:hypothetical protein
MHGRLVIVVLAIEEYERLTESVNANGGYNSSSRPARQVAEPSL